MTKAAKVALINATIANARNELARSRGVEAYIREDGAICYRDTAKGYARRLTFREMLGNLHGQDMRALLNAF